MDGLSRRDAEAMVGRTFGEFVVRELLSSGGFGVVFRAEQPALAREAVIKVLQTRHRSREGVVQRFLREAQLASRLDHPYAAHTYAFGAEPDGVLWIAMELVRGTPLDQLLEAQGPIALERFVPLLERICEVIQTAHEQGIVHRDLKPANVMVLSRAGRLLPKLLDLGLAKVVDALPDAEVPRADPSMAATMPSAGDAPPGDSGGRLTEDGAIMGSPLYMAPEQWVDAGTVDARTDQYALGVLCYEALTGKPPFAGTSPLALAMAHARQPPRALGAGFPVALDAVLARAMAKRAGDRYPGVMDLASAFRRASGVAAEPVTLPRLPETLRLVVVAEAPQPLAQAVASLDAARNAHQARDALWQVLRVAVRLLGVTALAGHAHVGTGASARQSTTEDILRRLRRRGLSDLEWLEVARELCRPFAAMRDAHPMPELVGFVCGDARPLTSLLALRGSFEESGGGSDEQVRELLDRAIPLAAALLEELAFLSAYPLVVPGEEHAEVWMGVRRNDRAQLVLRGKPMPVGQPALSDADGVPVLALWPYVQLVAPSPGAAEHLFFFEGKGRRGARLVAVPDAFEHEDDALWNAFGSTFADTADALHQVSAEEQCPFPGLAAFTREQAGSFFGRERETEAFVNRLRVQPLLAVVGPSGAGKSSFVQAGVIPALPDGWQAITVRPGPSPLVSLAARLQASGIDVGDLRAEVEEHPGALGSMLRARKRGTLLLVIDQLEELFTLCEDPVERSLYVDVLVRAARSADDPVRIVFTLRDDFLLHAEALPALRSRLGQGLQLLTTPAEADLRRILVEPIARAGYELDDPALADEMVAAIADAPGALALLSFTASKLWELRDRRFRQLGRKAYVSLGGVGGALAQHAETTLKAMSADEQRLVREVFRHAVTAEGTRAVLSRAELDQVLGGGTHATSVVEQLVAARLLVVSDAEGGGERVEITHEALLGAWPRVVQWRREDAEGARLRDQLRAAARQWEERGRASGLLWRGDALAEYRLWRARHASAMTASEEAFAAASLADVARGRRIRTMILAAAFAVLGVGVVGLLLLNARANRQRARAEAAARTLNQNLQQQYEDQGRRLVLAADPLQALAYLAKAAELGAHGPAHEFLVAEAVRATDGELFEVRHDGPLTTVRFSADGSRLLTGSYDHAVRLWDVRTGALLHTLTHQGLVIRASFSPDDRTVLSASFDRTAALWDAATGARLQTFAHDGELMCALYSPDGTSVLTASADDTVRVWEARSGALRFAARGEGAGQRVCAFSPDGAMVAAGDERGTTRVWDARTGALVSASPGQHKAVRSIRFSPDAARIVAGSADGTAVVSDARSGDTIHVLAHTATVLATVFSPDGGRIATASNDHTAAVWDAASGTRLLTLGGHSAGVNRVVYSPDGARLITVGDDANARMWDAVSGRPIARWLGHRDRISDVAFDPTSQRVATASDDGSGIVWSGEPQERVTWLLGHAGIAYGASFSPDGNHVATASQDGSARIWDAATGHELLVLVGHQGAVHHVAYSPDGLTVATAGEDGTIRTFDARSGAPRHVSTDHGASVSSVGWAPDGTRLVSAADDGTVRVWSAGSGEALRTIAAPGGFRVTSATFTVDGSLIAATGDDNVTRFWDPDTGAERSRRLDTDLAVAVAFDPTGTRAASPVNNQAVKVWNVASGARLVDLVGHVGQTNAASWSPDGTMIVTAAMDGTARIWDADTGAVLAIYPQGTQVYSASFSPDGTRIVTAADDGTVAIRQLPRYRGDANDFARLLRCRVPFVVEGDRVASRPRAAAACAAPVR